MGFKPDFDDQLVSFSALTLLVWFGHLACKNRPRNDLLCVESDVKPYTHSLLAKCCSRMAVYLVVAAVGLFLNTQCIRLGCMLAETNSLNLRFFRCILYIVLCKLYVVCSSVILMSGLVLQINDPDPYIWMVSRNFSHSLELCLFAKFLY